MIDLEKKRERERAYYYAHIESERERKRIQQLARRGTEEYREWNRNHKRLKRAVDPKTRVREAVAHRRNALRKNFKITPGQYEEMLSRQDGRCAICLLPERVRGRRLAVDHCHSTGKIRGLLCHNCNVAIGLLRDDGAALARAIEYLSQKAQNQ